MRNRNMTGMKDISSLIPNLFIPDYGSRLDLPVSYGESDLKLIPLRRLYVDGMPYFEKSAFDFDFNEVDHLEILRGPQGTLYGAIPWEELSTFIRNPLCNIKELIYMYLPVTIMLLLVRHLIMAA